MIDYFIKNAENPLSNIKVDLGTDKPLVDYVIKAICGLQVINQLRLYPIEGAQNAPRIEIGNWKWNPHPSAELIQTRRRETGIKLKTKTISDIRVGILEFDIYCEARDKNKNLVSDIIHNTLYIPIEDERGCYLLDNLMYSEYQLVDKLLYPSGKDSFTLKSLLPVVIRYEEASATSLSGYVVQSKVGMVKIFTTMEPILSCFMHIKAPLSYLGVFPILQFCDHISDDKDEYEYFQPVDGVDVYVKGYKKGIEEFDYVKSILVMAIKLIEKYKPQNIDELRSPEWWVYQLSYYDNIIEHRGACHQMHVARMLDTISAQVLPIPEIDKRNMIALLRYILETEFDNVNVFSYENKRLRKNEVVSTIITAIVSDKLKGMFKFGTLLKMSDMQPKLKFSPDIILRKMYELGTVHVTDFANDLDYYHQLRFTRKGPNSLGRLDKHKINLTHRQLHPTAIGLIDLHESSKDVGQSGIISPWADLSMLNNADINKYPNIKFKLYQFITEHFPEPALRFNATNIVEFNQILDKMVLSSYINLDYHIPGGDSK